MLSRRKWSGNRRTAADSPVSKRSIANYLNYLQEAFFILLTERFSFSPRKRIMNPKKLYLLDTGFAGLAPGASENRGRRLENLVAVEIYRRRQEIFYHYRDGRECALIVQSGTRSDLAVQVTCCLEAGNRDRKLGGLLAAIESDRALRLSFASRLEHRSP